MKKAKVEGNADRVLAFLKDNPEGVTQQMVDEELQVSASELMKISNTFLQNHLIDLLEGKGGELIFKLKDAVQAMKMKGMTREDHLVYQTIQVEKNNGVWSRDIKRRTNLAQTAVAKILKNLENRELIKAVKSVNEGKRKIYVLWDLEPAPEITGGLWFQGQELDVAFIDTLKQQCQRYIAQKGTATASELEHVFKESNIFTVPVTEEQLSLILTTLQYDGVMENAPGSEDEDVWRLVKYKITNETAFTSFPCGVCPVINECTPGGVISPEKCIYFDEYFQF